MECLSRGEVSSYRPVGVVMNRHAFVLSQLLLVLLIISVSATMFLSIFTRSRTAARRSACDMQLQTITVALDAFREETGRYPEHLDELLTKKYLADPAMLKCPSDLRSGSSYDDYYIMRAARDSGELPILCCPLCSSSGHLGLQAFKGRYTKQFAIRPAKISQAVRATIERPGHPAFSAGAGMALQNGDVVRTAKDGSTLIYFADGSYCNLTGSSQITILQSFIAGHTYAPLYTLIRQTSGDVSYHVNHGSKFDVSTPTATAVALGTVFRIKQDEIQQWWLLVSESKVLVSDLGGRDIVAAEGATLPSPGDIPVMSTSQWTFLGKLENYVVPGTMTNNTTNNTMMRLSIVRTRIRLLRSAWRQSATSQ